MSSSQPKHCRISVRQWRGHLVFSIKLKGRQGSEYLNYTEKKNKLIFKCFSVCVEFVCLCVYENTPMHTCGDRRRHRAPSSSLCFIPLRKYLSLNSELVTFQLGWQPTSLMGLPAFTYPSAVTIGAHAPAWLFMWLAAGYPDTGLHACIASALSSWTIFSPLVLFVLAD